MFSHNKFMRNEESYETSDFDLDSKYTALQNNHRRLLGVTSLLTEALEYTVRGNDFDLENTLNECMKVYPELFGNDKQRPHRQNSRRKKYNTSVSEDGTDIGFAQTINAQLNYHLNDFYGDTSAPHSPRGSNVNATNPMIFVESESDKSHPNSSGTSRPRFLSNLIEENTNKKSFFVLTPEYRSESGHRARDKTPRKTSIGDSVVDESSYLVNLPDSDTDANRIEINKRSNQNVKISGEDENVEMKAQTNENYWPYEIIVKTPQNLNKADANLVIQIKPETPESAKYKKRILNEKIKQIPNDMETQTLETCILISNQTEISKSNHQKLHNMYEENIVKELQENIDHFERSLNNLPSTSSMKNDTMDKLQKLSTGLKVQTNEMQVVPVILDETECTITEVQNSFGIPIRQYENSSNDKTPEKRNANKIYYEKLKETLISASVNDSVTILQNLRLTLIHTLAKERAELVASYVEHDILNINKSLSLVDSLLPKEIVNGWDLILQQMLLKFVNTMCSIWKGRDYLATNTKIISSLLEYFFKKSETKPTTDAISLDMLMAIFNKLSTRHNQQVVLVNSGIVEKLLYNLVEGHSSMTFYRLKHSLGVLINSCTYDNGRNLLEPMTNEILNLLKSLLMKNDKRVLPYIARFIYVLMANEVYHKKAKEIDLVSILEKSINISNKRLKLQLDVLKNIITQSKPHEFLYGTEENFMSNVEAEMDELEEEVEIGDRPISTSTAEWHDRTKININKVENPVKASNKAKSIPRKIAAPRNQREKPIIPKSKAVTPKPPISVKKSIKPEKPRVRSQLKKTLIPTLIHEKPINDTIEKRRPKRHEIVESPDLSTKSYIILEETNKGEVNKVNDEITNSVNEVLKEDAMYEEKILHENLSSSQDNNPKSNIKIDEETSFLVLDENDSNKTSDDSILNSSPEICNLVEHMPLPSDIVKSDEMLDKLSHNETLLINMDGNPTVSLFVQQGRVTEIEYDYCEDTKEIQSPIKYDNIFKNNRQSPYKGMLKDNQKPIVFKQPKVEKKQVKIDVEIEAKQSDETLDMPI